MDASKVSESWSYCDGNDGHYFHDADSCADNNGTWITHSTTCGDTAEEVKNWDSNSWLTEKQSKCCAQLPTCNAIHIKNIYYCTICFPIE